MRPEHIQHPANILVVDDTPANLQLLAEMLRERGHKVRPVPDGRLALQAARREPPDLVLLDINMPDMDGYEVCQELKADPRLAEIPIIFISANTETMDKVRAFSLGGVDYVTKPFHFEEVHARVGTHLELRQKQRAIEEGHDRLRELERLRDELVHMIVHDMRSPLMALIEGLTFLKRDLAGHIGKQNMEDIDAALAGGRRLSDMADELLNVSRLEANEMPLERVQCDLTEVVRSAARNIRAMEPDREVILEMPRQAQAMVDGKILGRVVENLVSNGMKHTPAGRPLVVSISEQSDGIRVAIRDRGPGIPAEFREKIFEKFGVVQARGEHKYHSAGLGLAFCKLAVEAHGGRIGVDSLEGQGSTFWFVLPTEADLSHDGPCGEGSPSGPPRGRRDRQRRPGDGE